MWATRSGNSPRATSRAAREPRSRPEAAASSAPAVAHGQLEQHRLIGHPQAVPAPREPIPPPPGRPSRRRHRTTAPRSVCSAIPPGPATGHLRSHSGTIAEANLGRSMMRPMGPALRGIDGLVAGPEPAAVQGEGVVHRHAGGDALEPQGGGPARQELEHGGVRLGPPAGDLGQTAAVELAVVVELVVVDEVAEQAPGGWGPVHYAGHPGHAESRSPWGSSCHPRPRTTEAVRADVDGCVEPAHRGQVPRAHGPRLQAARRLAGLQPRPGTGRAPACRWRSRRGGRSPRCRRGGRSRSLRRPSAAATAEGRGSPGLAGDGRGRCRRRRSRRRGPRRRRCACAGR